MISQKSTYGQYVYFINQKLLLRKTELVGKYKSLPYWPFNTCIGMHAVIGFPVK